MTVINIGTPLLCEHCNEHVYSTLHEGWPKERWWHHGFVRAACRLESAKGNVATPKRVLMVWGEDLPLEHWYRQLGWDR